MENQNLSEWTKIEPGIWRPENEGDSIEGILVGVEDSPRFDNKNYSLEVKREGKVEQITVFGTTVLDNKMKYAKIGNQVRIVFKGIEKNQKKQDVKIFDVFTK